MGAGVALSGIPFFKETTFLSKIKWLNRTLNRVNRTQSIFYPGSLIKDKTRYFIENSRCSVGVFVNRGFTGISTTMILLQSETDDFLLRYARRLMRNNKSVSIFIMDVNQVLQTSAKVREATDELRKMFPNSVKIIKSSKNNASVISKFSFLLLSYQAWNNLSENDAAMLRSIPSTLIINKKTSRFHIRNAEKTQIVETDHA